MTDTYFHYHEAKDEAERLSRVLGQNMQAIPVTCDCDFHRMCGKCGGEGRYYEVVEVPELKLRHPELRSLSEAASEAEEMAFQ